MYGCYADASVSRSTSASVRVRSATPSRAGQLLGRAGGGDGRGDGGLGGEPGEGDGGDRHAVDAGDVVEGGEDLPPALGAEMLAAPAARGLSTVVPVRYLPVRNPAASA
ncbi:hypothetical protein GCM10020256_40740 [Streptomyces thermocoprophilus]